MTQDAVDVTEEEAENKPGGPGPEAQAEERAKLQEIVRAFAKQAVLGTPVGYLNAQSQYAKEDGVYSLDKSLRRLSVPTSKTDKKTFLLADAVCGKTLNKEEVREAVKK